MSDLISRQTAIDMYGDWYVEEGTEEGFIGTLKHLLKRLPSVQSEQRWIPKSEKLPEDDTRVLVTIQVGDREPVVRSGYYFRDGHFHIDNGDCWNASDKELKAWMPLPPSYQGE